MSHPLLTIRNHHSAECGDPPVLADESFSYLGYFQNEHGEQWVFTYSRNAKKAELRGGDIGWNQVHSVREGKAAGLVLSREEQQWLKACWAAATAFGS
jgi:hypothetical protein